MKNVPLFGIPKSGAANKPYQFSEFWNVVQFSKKHKNVPLFFIPKSGATKKTYQFSEFWNVVQISKKYKSVSGFGIQKNGADWEIREGGLTTFKYP